MERNILEVFAARYPVSAQRRGGKALRLRGWESLLPEGFVSGASRLSFLDAMERLERDGTLRLFWAKRRVGDDLISAELVDPAALFRRLGLPLPEEKSAALSGAAAFHEEAARARGDERGAVFFRFVAAKADSLTERILPKDLEDAAVLFEFDQAEEERLPIRALSVRLYRNSKRLETLASVLRPIVTQAFRDGKGATETPLLPERAYPEAAVAGNAELVFLDSTAWALGSRAITLSLAAAEDLSSVRKEGGMRALSVENKETFHAFVRCPLDFDFIVCTGGRPNRAVRAVLRVLASSGAVVFHSGDLDADGIAILAEVHDLCGAAPFGMDAKTFDRYLPYARELDASLVSRLSSVPDAAFDLPGIRVLAERIRETRRGVEQEIIDYYQ